MVGLTMSNRGGVYSFVLVFICAIVTIDVLYVHQRAFRLYLVLNNIGFSPPPIEEKKSGLTSQNLGVAGLSCKAYGGPSDEDAAEMVYWQDIPVDASFVSPFKSKEQQYLTFEPDEGGWNNIRMSMETAVTMALAMGRTLVMPPEQGMHLLSESEKKQKDKFTFTDFFPFESVAKEHKGVDIISFEEFLKREVMTGHIVDATTGNPSFPPENRTNWNGIRRSEAKKLDRWTRTIGTVSTWDLYECMAGFTAKPNDPEGEARLTAMAQNVTSIHENERYQMFANKPVAVDAPPLDRLMETMADRNGLCIYDQELQKAKVFHLTGDDSDALRLLVHFYAFLFFENWKQDLWTKRFVRDHLRYVDEIQCAAARVVHALREISMKNGNGGVFDTFHIRRTDFQEQYENTFVEIDVIFNNTFDVLEENSTIYIATDERNKKFFDLLRKHYKIYFMDDFKDLLEGINTNYFGMVDQLIASRGRTFIGTYYSTFTGFINRVRGYHSQKDKADGFELGVINSYFDIPLDHKHDMREYRPLRPPWWKREFPIAWRDIDKGIDDFSMIETPVEKALEKPA